jgi:hypothetical protein
MELVKADIRPKTFGKPDDKTLISSETSGNEPDVAVAGDVSGIQNR